MIKTAVIGCGAMGKNHIRNYAEMDETELVAVCDVNKKLAKKYSKIYNCNAYSNYMEMIEKEHPEIVSIVVPTALHKKVGLEVMSKGVNVLIEKPISPTVEEAKAIVKSSKKNNVKLMVGHIERFNPAVIEAKKRIDSLGRIIEFDAIRTGPYVTRMSNSSVITDLTIHDIDTIRFLNNGAGIKELYAVVNSKISKKEDLFLGIAKYDNKQIAFFQTNRVTPKKTRELRIIGEKGMFVIDYLNQDLFLYENGYFKEPISYTEVLKGVLEGKMIKFHINKKEPLRQELEEFVKSVKEDREPLVTGEVATENLVIALKFLESAKKRGVLKLE